MLGTADPRHLPLLLPAVCPAYPRCHRHEQQQETFEEQHAFRPNRVSLYPFRANPVRSPPGRVVDTKEFLWDHRAFPCLWICPSVRIVPKSIGLEESGHESHRNCARQYCLSVASIYCQVKSLSSEGGLENCQRRTLKKIKMVAKLNSF